MYASEALNMIINDTSSNSSKLETLQRIINNRYTHANELKSILASLINCESIEDIDELIAGVSPILANTNIPCRLSNTNDESVYVPIVKLCQAVKRMLELDVSSIVDQLANQRCHVPIQGDIGDYTITIDQYISMYGSTATLTPTDDPNVNLLSVRLPYHFKIYDGIDIVNASNSQKRCELTLTLDARNYLIERDLDKSPTQKITVDVIATINNLVSGSYDIAATKSICDRIQGFDDGTVIDLSNILQTFKQLTGVSDKIPQRIYDFIDGVCSNKSTASSRLSHLLSYVGNQVSLESDSLSELFDMTTVRDNYDDGNVTFSTTFIENSNGYGKMCSAVSGAIKQAISTTWSIFKGITNTVTTKVKNYVEPLFNAVDISIVDDNTENSTIDVPSCIDTNVQINRDEIIESISKELEERVTSHDTIVDVSQIKLDYAEGDTEFTVDGLPEGWMATSEVSPDYVLSDDKTLMQAKVTRTYVDAANAEFTRFTVPTYTEKLNGMYNHDIVITDAKDEVLYSDLSNKHLFYSDQGVFSSINDFNYRRFSVAPCITDTLWFWPAHDFPETHRSPHKEIAGSVLAWKGKAEEAAELDYFIAVEWDDLSVCVWLAACKGYAINGLTPFYASKASQVGFWTLSRVEGNYTGANYETQAEKVEIDTVHGSSNWLAFEAVNSNISSNVISSARFNRIFFKVKSADDVYTNCNVCLRNIMGCKQYEPGWDIIGDLHFTFGEDMVGYQMVWTFRGPNGLMYQPVGLNVSDVTYHLYNPTGSDVTKVNDQPGVRYTVPLPSSSQIKSRFTVKLPYTAVTVQPNPGDGERAVNVIDDVTQQRLVAIKPNRDGLEYWCDLPIDGELRWRGAGVAYNSDWEVGNFRVYTQGFSRLADLNIFHLESGAFISMNLRMNKSPDTYQVEELARSNSIPSDESSYQWISITGDVYHLRFERMSFNQISTAVHAMLDDSLVQSMSNKDVWGIDTVFARNVYALNEHGLSYRYHVSPINPSVLYDSQSNKLFGSTSDLSVDQQVKELCYRINTIGTILESPSDASLVDRYYYECFSSSMNVMRFILLLAQHGNYELSKMMIDEWLYSRPINGDDAVITNTMIYDLVQIAPTDVKDFHAYMLRLWLRQSYAYSSIFYAITQRYPDATPLSSHTLDAPFKWHLATDVENRVKADTAFNAIVLATLAVAIKVVGFTAKTIVRKKVRQKRLLREAQLKSNDLALAKKQSELQDSDAKIKQLRSILKNPSLSDSERSQYESQLNASIENSRDIVSSMNSYTSKIDKQTRRNNLVNKVMSVCGLSDDDAPIQVDNQPLSLGMLAPDYSTRENTSDSRSLMSSISDVHQAVIKIPADDVFTQQKEKLIDMETRLNTMDSIVTSLDELQSLLGTLDSGIKEDVMVKVATIIEALNNFKFPTAPDIDFNA